jgi:hypothetical protein
MAFVKPEYIKRLPFRGRGLSTNHDPAARDCGQIVIDQ